MDDYADDFEAYGDDFEEDAAPIRLDKAATAVAALAAAAAAPTSTPLDKYYERLRTGIVRIGVVQFPESTASASTQCDAATSEAVAVQVPDDLGVASAAAGAARGAGGNLVPDQRSLAFIKSAATVIERLCEESAAALDAVPRPGETATVVFGAARLCALPVADFGPLIAGREVLCATASPARAQPDVAVALGPQAAAAAGGGVEIDAGVRASSLVLILGSASAASSVVRFVLLCRATPSCLAFSADGGFLLAGSSAAAVHVWNLAEPAWLHGTEYGRSAAAGRLSVPSGLRPPSYSTHAKMGPGSGGGAGGGGGGEAAARAVVAAPIRCVLPLVRQPLLLLGEEAAAAAEAADGAEGGAPEGADAAGAQPQPLSAVARVGGSAGLPYPGAGLASLLGGSSARRPSQRGNAAGVLAAASSANTSGGLAAFAAGGVPAGGGGGALQFVSVDDVGQVDSWVALRVAGAGAAAGAPSNSLPAAMGPASASSAGGQPDAAAAPSPSAAPAASAGAAFPALATSLPSLGALIDQADFGRSVTSSVRCMRVASAAASAAGVAAAPTRGGGPKTAGTAAAAASSVSASVAVYAADVSPADASRLLLACGDGSLRQVSRTGTGGGGSERLSPAVLTRSGAAAPAPAATAVAFHPHPRLAQSFALAGYEDGAVALFSLAHATASKTWLPPWGAAPAFSAARPAAVARLLWVPTRPGAFVAVDERGGVAVWDIAASAAGPVLCTSLLQAAGAGAASASAVVVGAELVGGSPLCPRSLTLAATLSTGATVLLPLGRRFATTRRGELGAVLAILRRLQ